MPLCLVLHDLPSAGIEAVQAALWEVSDSHWSPTSGSFAVSTGVSVPYLCSHLERALGRAGVDGAIMVIEAGAHAAACGVPENGMAWIRDQIDEFWGTAPA